MQQSLKTQGHYLQERIVAGILQDWAYRGNNLVGSQGHPGQNLLLERQKG